MKYVFWIFGLLMAGIFGLVFIVMFESITVNNESEYYTLREAMEAAMMESIDLACFRNSNVIDGETIDSDGNGACNGTIKIVEQKFVENFTRRFAASISGDASNFNLEFLDIIESPPKATIIVSGNTGEYHVVSNSADSFTILNNLSGIIEAKDWGYMVLPEDDIEEDSEIIVEETSNSGLVSNRISNRNLYVSIPGSFSIIFSGLNGHRALYDKLRDYFRGHYNCCNFSDYSDKRIKIRVNCSSCGQRNRGINLYDETIREFFNGYNNYIFVGWSDASECKNIIAKYGDATVTKNSSDGPFYACFRKR